MKIEWAYAGGLLAFLALAWAGTKIVGIGGEKAEMVFYWLAALGVTGTALLYFVKEKWEARKSGGQPEENTGGGQAPGGDGSEVDQLVREAETRFASARQGGGALAGMPVLFVVGESGTTKTSVLQHSGLEPELLAGQTQGQDGGTAPTRAANLWLSRKAIFVEAGGKLWSDNQGWTKLLKRLTPSQLKSAVGGAKQAPRAAILCVDAEKFLQQGASESMQRAARAAQARLQEISQQFGINFPVYVLFTRCDRLPFFLDYVRNMGTEEALQVLGATLPVTRFEAGVFAQQQTQRLAQAFEDVFYSLADKRIEYLPREADVTKLPPTYEFPREFRKLKNLIVPFLVDVCRPSQLTVTPFLRGFYFCGVRPVVVADVAPVQVQRQPERTTGPGGATSFFNIPQQPAQPMPVAAPASGGRKVPQWVFLTRLFNEVILEDPAAMGAAGPSAQASTLRRVLLGAAAALALLFTILATVSFFNNRSLEGDVQQATEQLKAVRLAPGSVPALDDLKRLDSLRQQLMQLTAWERNGAPLGYRWGLYTGSDLLPLARKAYYQSFNQLLFRETQQDRMLSYLRSRPSQAAPTDDYNYGYHVLRSYLLTANEWKRTSDDRERDYLWPQLRDRWIDSHKDVDADRRALAEKQFEFYAGDLRNGNPFGDREDADAVRTARVWLGSFPLVDSRYNAMLDAAEKKAKKVNYNHDFPNTASVVINNKDVRGAFTKDGWAAMQAIFKSPNISESEQWVLPDSFKKSRDNPADMLALIKDRYVGEYIKRWRDYFNTDTNVLGYMGIADAANKLKEHSGVRPAVLYLIGLASAHTAPEPASDPMAQKVRAAFEWAHNVVPPGQYLVPGKNDGYVNALTQLQMAAEAAAKDKNDQGARSALDSAQKQAELAARTLGRPLRPDQDASLDKRILDILVKPTLLQLPAREDAAGACVQFSQLKNKFPFNPTAAQDATVEELDAFLKPGTGLIWKVVEAPPVKDAVIRLGNQYQANPAASPQVNPEFLRFLNQVAGLAAAFYPGGQGPKLNYSVQLSEVELLLGQTKAKSGNITIDGKKADLGGAAQSLTWTGAPSHSVNFEYNETLSFTRTNMWAIFRFFVDASVAPSGAGYLVTWPVKGGAANQVIANAKFNVNLGGAPAVFDRRLMAGMRCVAQAVK